MKNEDMLILLVVFGPIVLGIIICVIGAIIVDIRRKNAIRRQAENDYKLQTLEETTINIMRENIQRDLDIQENEYNNLVKDVLSKLHYKHVNSYSFDITVSKKSIQAVDNYTDIDFFKEFSNKIDECLACIKVKHSYALNISKFLDDNEYKTNSQYYRLESMLKQHLENKRYLSNYVVKVLYTSPAGKKHHSKLIYISEERLLQIQNNPSLLMTKGELNKYQKDQAKELLSNKQNQFYNKINEIIDNANNIKELLIVKSDKDILDNSISQLFDRTVSSIAKIKTIDSGEWELIYNYIENIEKTINDVISRNNQILAYYNSNEFLQIKQTCDTLMSTQREFNQYIEEKVESISSLFGTRIVRTETIQDDEYNYIHPYKKSITPFTAEVSASVFASAENSPLEYVVKNFYPDKTKYPEQIQKLHLLIEELETLKEAKVIIDNYKKDYQQYLANVPSFIFQYDSDGFYSRLGFANISENVLTVEYKFVYTSFGGKSQKSFTVPMTEETIIALISMLENKLTTNTFSKEQRQLMTSKLRKKIKERDNYTCCHCGNSIWKEPNLLLEVDHIVPVADGGYTVEDNLQTLCWVCNRHKSKKSNDDIKTANVNRESIQAQVIAENAKNNKIKLNLKLKQ